MNKFLLHLQVSCSPTGPLKSQLTFLLLFWVSIAGGTHDPISPIAPHRSPAQKVLHETVRLFPFLVNTSEKTGWVNIK